jgi:uncharacterized protein (TIRG00374 family)
VIGAGRATRSVQLALLFTGVVLFAVLVRHVGADRLLDDLRGFGSALLGVVAFELAIDACNTVAWRTILPPSAPVGVGVLFWIRQAGVAVNQLTPTATVGGEIVKTMLLAPRLPSAVTAASLVAARMSYALGQTILVLLGLSTVLGRMRQTPDLAVAVVVTFLATVGGVLGFVWLQRRGIFATAAGAFRRLGLLRGLADRLHAGSTALDTALAEFYRNRPRAFAASVAWHVAGQLVGLLQLAFILTTLGSPTSLSTCLAIEAFALVLDSAVFLVPGRIGVQEASRVLVFTTFGLGAPTGLAVAVIVRLNQLAVAMVGLAAFGALSLRPLDRRRHSNHPSDP